MGSIISAARRPARRLERQLHLAVVTIGLLEPECEVCGNHVDVRMLRPWNGKSVCTHCINDMTQEVPEHAFVH
ncbi:hypothetical protein [Cohnella nanjingensis]|uniref:Uncharacterized protein n=1 Tax=Cohnella nanjingensis TaxID=1387779 RepID=A0A7X0RMK6_9BACL|nr:hypothetical protein [Cohnella nanjingensis]MBB6670247.1 hypothetical protein [Cohnella nanjingensis]